MWVLRTKFWSSARVSCALNRWAISSDLIKNFGMTFQVQVTFSPIHLSNKQSPMVRFPCTHLWSRLPGMGMQEDTVDGDVNAPACASHPCCSQELPRWGTPAPAGPMRRDTYACRPLLFCVCGEFVTIHPPFSFLSCISVPPPAYLFMVSFKKSFLLCEAVEYFQII